MAVLLDCNLEIIITMIFAMVTSSCLLLYGCESQVIQGGLQAQLGPGNQSAVQTVKDVDESLKISIHQVRFCV